MGGIISRFRKKKSNLEILESLETELKSIETYSRETEQRHKTIVGHLLLFSVAAYVMVAGFFYFFFFPASLYDQLLYVVPLLLFPLIIVFLKRGISWWYRRKISKNQEKYQDIQIQKKQLLEEVMDKETYKVARQILEKFAPDQLPKGPNVGVTSSFTRSASDNSQYGKTPNRKITPMNMLPSSSTTARSELRHRQVAANTSGNMSIPPVSRTMPSRSPVSSLSSSPLQSPVSAPLQPAGTCASNDSSPVDNSVSSQLKAGHENSQGTPSEISHVENDSDEFDLDVEDSSNALSSVDSAESPSVPEVAITDGENGKEKGNSKGYPANQSNLTRPILSVNRSILDRLVEYLVGDGVNHRYALICGYCNSHNGMALKEEFEFLSFRCCYCFHWNPARKQRLQAPKLENLLPEEENSCSTEESPHHSDEEEGRRKSDSFGPRKPNTRDSSARNSLSESEKSEPCTDLTEERNDFHKTVTKESNLTAEKKESGSGDSEPGRAADTEMAH